MATKAKVDRDWLKLPNGSFIFLPDVRRNFPRGCRRCGAMQLVIKREPMAGVSCPNCVRPRKGQEVIGRLDVLTGRVVVEEVQHDESRMS